MPSPLEQQRIDTARASAAAQVEWYSQNKLFYKEPPKPGRASWGLGLHPHFITSQQHNELVTTTPLVIADYHRTAAYLLELTLNPNIRKDSRILEKLHQVLTYTNPPETENLWKAMLARGKKMPGSSRPDILISDDSSRPWQHIEYNADGSADKGNTLGVARVTQEVLGYPTVGIGLDQAFAQEIRQQLPHRDQITVATILPDAYRTEYDPQNKFFAKKADEIAGISWTTARVSQLEYRPDGVYTDGKKIDFIDREVKTPGFTDSHDFRPEMDLYRSVIEGKVELFGTVLPHGDKLFLAAIFDPNLTSTIETLIGNAGLARLRAYHPTTHLFDPHQKTYRFDDQDYSIDDLKQPDGIGTVLKHTGDNMNTTGSNGVFISRGYKNETWRETIDQAKITGLGRRTHLVIQELIEPQRFAIQAISSTTATPKDYTVPVRFAPYYVRIGDHYVLGDVLVTAGTDREVTTLQSFNIHGQRDNSYQGVAVK